MKYSNKNIGEGNKKAAPLTKQQFYPNVYAKECLYSMLNECGSMIRNTQYKKSECRKINKTIKRARYLAFFPYSSSHYYGVNRPLNNSH